jgi:hypothetical protein
MEIRITKEGKPCFDEFVSWSLQYAVYPKWTDIVLAHQALCHYVAQEGHRARISLPELQVAE